MVPEAEPSPPATSPMAKAAFVDALIDPASAFARPADVIAHAGLTDDQKRIILLVDFIRHARTPGRPLREVLLEAGAIRFKPILLTALAAMIGAAVICSTRSSRASPSACCSAWRRPPC